MYDALPLDIYRYMFLHRLKTLVNVRLLYIYMRLIPWITSKIFK